MHQHLAELKRLTLLFVENEPLIQQKVNEMLNLFFDRVLVADNGAMALDILETNVVDIVLSDIKMPIMDGLTFLKRLRLLNNQVPFILLSSLSDQNTLLDAANAGIDGYIVKPIDLEELIQTFIKVLMRRNMIIREFSFGNGIVYKVQTQELYCHGQLVDLGKRERALLQLFITYSDKTLTKERIIATIWSDESVTESALKNLLSRLRKKIGCDLIVSVKGAGWRLNISG